MQSIRKGIAILLLLSYGTAIFAQSIVDTTGIQQPANAVPAPHALTYNDKLASSIAGRDDASANHGTVGWGVFGALSGFLFGIIGFGASTVISIIPSPKPEQMPDTATVKDAESYSEAYTSKARSKNIMTTAICGGIGWLISIPIVMAMKK